MWKFIIDNWERVTAVTGGAFALYGLFSGLRVRQSELKLNQAKTAHEFIKEIHAHEKASQAIKMFDWFEIDMDEGNGKTNCISYENMIEHLKKFNEKQENLKEMDKEVKEMMNCYDWFFYYLDRLEQGIYDKLIRFENVYYIFLPYYNKYAANDEHREVYDRFIAHRGYTLVPHFWNRFKEGKVEGLLRKVKWVNLFRAKEEIREEQYI
jgi:hypothetical protein